MDPGFEKGSPSGCDLPQEHSVLVSSSDGRKHTEGCLMDVLRGHHVD